MANLDFSIDVPVRSEWASAERLRASVGGCVLAMFGDVDASRALSLVTAELAENAIKYGRWGGVTETFRLRVWGGRPCAHVAVECPVDPDPAATQRLFDTLQWIAGFATAEEAYRARLLEIAASPGADGSRLGLVRVAYEAGCTLRAEIEGNVLRVTADVAW
jgi:hypothetical protein